MRAQGPLARSLRRVVRSAAPRWPWLGALAMIALWVASTPSPRPAVAVRGAATPIETGSVTSGDLPTAVPTELPTETPAVAATESPTPELDATADESSAASLSLEVSRASIDFGTISADPALAAPASGVVPVANERGAAYVLERAIEVTVKADGRWSGICRAETGAESVLPVDRLAWRPSGTELWQPFGPDVACLAGADVGGTTSIELDLRVRVEYGDPTGAFAAIVRFSVSS